MFRLIFTSMKKLIISFLTIVSLVACGEQKDEATTALDTGRNFIRASLDGDFHAAESYLLKDSMNVQMFKSYEEYYSKQPDEVKKNYRNSEYNINEIKEEGDSVTIINYSNSFMNQPMEVKVVTHGGQWKVDFKHTSAKQ